MKPASGRIFCVAQSVSTYSPSSSIPGSLAVSLGRTAVAKRRTETKLTIRKRLGLGGKWGLGGGGRREGNEEAGLALG